MSTKTAAAKPATKPAFVRVWETDPLDGVLAEQPRPHLARGPLPFHFPGPAPELGQEPGTAGFRFWVAGEALRRGAAFWAERAALDSWHSGQKLDVKLDAGVDLNAFYDRQALNFFHGPGAARGTVVFSGESPDILCHEMGHAILDALKPQLWGAASHEAAAFHESFGDMSAILSALQLPSLRTEILADTHGHLYRNSRLSRLAEQLGSAIRARFPDAVDADCLRNAVNSFIYQDPVRLPSRAPSSQLSSEPHSFSRVFTGAFFEALAGMLQVHAAQADTPTEAELLTVSENMADILLAGIRHAPVVSNFYAQVAVGMVSASAAVNAGYPAVLRGVFVRRAILSLHSAADVLSLQGSVNAAAMAPPDADATLASIALPATHYGLDQPLLVEVSSQHQGIAAHAFAYAEDRALEPTSSATAARAFADELFRHGRVDYGKHGRPEARLEHGRRTRSHRLEAEGGAIRLRRCLFDCGLVHG